MKKNIVLLAMLLVVTLSTLAEVKPYEWEANRKRANLSAEDRELSEIILKQHVEYNYVFEKNQLIMYTTTHLIVWVNSNEAIEKNNKIYISMNSTLDLVSLKARSINKEGKAINFDLKNLKEIKDEQSGNAYRIFAMEGVELDSEIEYFYTKKMSPDIYERIFTQFSAPVRASSFLLTSPTNLKFDFKSYYGYSDIRQNLQNTELNEYKGATANIPALKEEPFSYFDANRKRIEFKLAYNTARSQSRLYTWEEAAKTFYGILIDRTKSDEKAVEKFVTTLDDNPTQETGLRIKNIEKKIKTGIKIETNQYGDALAKLETLLKNKVASGKGITRLYVAVFEQLNIKCYPVITCSREKRKFDGAFDSWSYLNDFILYFPDTKKFLAPTSFESRYPLIPTEMTSQQGLFIEPFQVGSVKSALSSIDFIPAPDYLMNNDDLKIEVSFINDLSANRILQKRDFGGYNALQFMNYYDFMTKEQQTNMIENLTKQTAPDATIKTWKCTPSSEGETYKFLADVDYESAHFIEKAGNRILFKVGELIGPQTELYRDDKRASKVENSYNRGYTREIKVNVPPGYTIKNPQDLKIDVVYKDGDKTPFVFQSDYTLQGQTLIISIIEYYKEIYAPVDKYEEFRKVINAAADFNKVTLVVEKNK